MSIAAKICPRFPASVVGFRGDGGWQVVFWARNLFDKNYYELLSAAPGNTGLYVGQPGDPRAAGITLKLSLRRR